MSGDAELMAWKEEKERARKEQEVSLSPPCCLSLASVAPRSHQVELGVALSHGRAPLALPLLATCPPALAPCCLAPAPCLALWSLAAGARPTEVADCGMVGWQAAVEAKMQAWMAAAAVSPSLSLSLPPSLTH